MDNDNICYTFYTVNKIDLTGYSKLYFDVKITSSNGENPFSGGISTAKTDDLYENTPNWVASKTGGATTSFTGIIEVDISSFPNSYYPVFRLRSWSAWGMQTQRVEVYKIWLE